jgi:hypothetical protein
MDQTAMRSPWLWGGGGLLAVVVVIAGLYATGWFGGGETLPPEPAPVQSE